MSTKGVASSSRQKSSRPWLTASFVFTAPKRLRIYFRFDRALLGDMARLA